MFRRLQALWALSCALLLAACGDGGGDDTPSVALSFSPARLTATVKAGISSPLTVNVAVIDLAAIGGGKLYVYVVDSQQVLTTQVDLVAVDATHLVGTLHTSPTLVAGNYEGAFKIQVCRDAGCASQVHGSPFDLAYRITVTGP